MIWWSIAMAVVIFAVSYGCRLRRRRAARVRLDSIKVAVERSLSALQQPDDTTALAPPDRERSSPGVVRPRSRVVLGDPRTLSTTLTSGGRSS